MHMKIWKRFAPALLVAGIVAAQALIGTLADITGDGSAHKVSTSKIPARWVQFVCPAGNSGTAVRIGDSNVSASRGLPCAAGGGFMLPPLSTAAFGYDLSTLYYLAQSNDKISVTYGK